jgi:hypothetical protein
MLIICLDIPGFSSGFICSNYYVLFPSLFQTCMNCIIGFGNGALTICLFVYYSNLPIDSYSIKNL